MLSPANLRLFLCSQPTDMRKSFDGLSGMIRQFLSQDPTSGQVFVFFVMYAVGRLYVYVCKLSYVI